MLCMARGGTNVHCLFVYVCVAPKQMRMWFFFPFSTQYILHICEYIYFSGCVQYWWYNTSERRRTQPKAQVLPASINKCALTRVLRSYQSNHTTPVEHIISRAYTVHKLKPFITSTPFLKVVTTENVASWIPAPSCWNVVFPPLRKDFGHDFVVIRRLFMDVPR